MPQLDSNRDRTQPEDPSIPSPGRERRAYPRRPAPEVFVALETPDAGGHPEWAGSAIDISGGGLSMPLPEDVPVGSELLLTFRLEDGTAFVRVPSTVVRRESGFGVGAVQFHDWDDARRLALLAYLARN